MVYLFSPLTFEGWGKGEGVQWEGSGDSSILAEPTVDSPLLHGPIVVYPLQEVVAPYRPHGPWMHPFSTVP